MEEGNEKNESSPLIGPYTRYAVCFSQSNSFLLWIHIVTKPKIFTVFKKYLSYHIRTKSSYPLNKCANAVLKRFAGVSSEFSDISHT